MRSGTEVLAPANGRISFVKKTLSGAGRELGLEVTGGGGQKFTIVFLHLSKILVDAGNVVQGQPIAKSGASGGGVESGFPAHLHFHMWSGTRSLDSHTRAMERLVLGTNSTDFREYNGSNGELNHSAIGGRYWFSNNVRVTSSLDGFDSDDLRQDFSPETSNGNFDDADCSSIAGWAWDSGLPASPVNVDIYDGDLLINTVSADEYRTDLFAAGIGNGYHGFNLYTPQQLKNGQVHTVRVFYAGTNVELPNSSRNLTCSGPPTPAPVFNGYFDEANCRKFYGWAWDQNRPNDPISVDVYDGNTRIGTVSANEYRADLEGTFGNGFHAFNFSPHASLKDGQNHTIHFKYSGTSTELNFSPRVFNSNACGPVTCPTSVGQGTGGLELEAFRNAYSDGGGHAALGCPTATVRFDGFTSMNGTISHYQATANGDIEYHTNGPNGGQAFAWSVPFSLVGSN
ncbi:MAG: M23 family metallopeptidase [Acidobacteria bacterium]|nr:M23 family metallopeptidase [Acidobacteriota bacterium]